MKLGDLVLRAYDRLGDDPVKQFFFERSALVDLMNRGALLMRAEIEDEWYTLDIPYVGGQPIYDWPSMNLRGLRVAYQDRTLEPRHELGLTGQDPKWMDRRGNRPIWWTGYAIAFSQFRIAPAPQESSPESSTSIAAPAGSTSAQLGCLVRYTDATGAYTALTDPADPSKTNPNTGIAISISGHTGIGGYGDIFAIAGARNVLTVWGVRSPTTMTDDDSDVPIKNAYQLGPLWYCLWKTFDRQGSRHNGMLAGRYKERWLDTIERGKARAAEPLPWQIHRRGDGATVFAEDWLYPRFDNTVTLPDGSQMTVTWPEVQD